MTTDSAAVDSFLAMLQEFYCDSYNDAQEISIRDFLEQEGIDDGEWLTRAYRFLRENFETRYIAKGMPKLPMVKDIKVAVRSTSMLASVADPYEVEIQKSMRMSNQEIINFISKARNSKEWINMSIKERGICAFWSDLWSEASACDALQVSPQYRENHLQQVREAVIQRRTPKSIWDTQKVKASMNAQQALTAGKSCVKE